MLEFGNVDDLILSWLEGYSVDVAVDSLLDNEWAKPPGGGLVGGIVDYQSMPLIFEFVGELSESRLGSSCDRVAAYSYLEPSRQT